MGLSTPIHSCPWMLALQKGFLHVNQKPDANLRMASFSFRVFRRRKLQPLDGFRPVRQKATQLFYRNLCLYIFTVQRNVQNSLFILVSMHKIHCTSDWMCPLFPSSFQYCIWNNRSFVKWIATTVHYLNCLIFTETSFPFNSVENV